VATYNKKFLIKNGLAVGGSSGPIDVIDEYGNWIGATGSLPVIVGASGSTGIQGASGSTGLQGASGSTGIQGASGTFSSWSVKTSNYTAIPNEQIIANTTGGIFTITLPATPSLGNYVIIQDGGNWSTNNLTIDRNGSTIEGIVDNLVLDIGESLAYLIYDGSTWQLSSTAGPTGATGATGFTGIDGASGATGAGLTGATGISGINGATGIQGASGSTGLSGASGVGLTGATGIQGVQGIQGTQGTQGASGSTGLQGASGSGASGIQGASGSTGLTGASGFIGADGASGATGIQGASGIGATGATGVTGATGIQGASGSTGLTGSTGVQGTFGGAPFDYYYSTNTASSDPTSGYLKFNNTNLTLATILYINEVDHESIDAHGYLELIDDSTSVIKGTFMITDELTPSNSPVYFSITGTQTYTSPYYAVPVTWLSGATSLANNLDVLITFTRTGDKGDTGLTGASGVVGPQGATGVQGASGVGLTGATGIQGASGSTGLTGASGFIGTDGATGVNGTNGATGVQGASGSTGLTGATGNSGGQGASGSTGLQGVQGIQGIQGASGSTGLGATGSTGPTGSTGIIGNPYAQSTSSIATNTAAVKNTLYVFTASLTLTLPASPTAGDVVTFVNLSGTITSIIARNGNKIMGLAEDMTVDVLNKGCNLVYSDATYGWVVA